MGPSSRSMSYFEQQREAILGEIAMVGNEFSSVETLWSQFENVMGNDETAETHGQPDEEDEQQGIEEGDEEPHQQQRQQSQESLSRGVKREGTERSGGRSKR
ncbi:hypothetical protein NQ176_g10630 [Zarea fungicola]|uniref:Uncharacterized protein n=1 Tax=Zarea fungicola TaxID=93591 RepID=A0ACC1MEF8_9HYPO|nr:hypothetical protein NQ176_g10630 [Lecanicillium fungicola]